jgi:ice-binding like protein
MGGRFDSGVSPCSGLTFRRARSDRALGRRGRASRVNGLGLSFWLVLALLLSLGLASTTLAAQPPVGLGTADSFAVLAGSAITNTGPSTINGDLGVSPGTAISGFPPGTVNGTVHAADAVAGQAKTDLTTAYNDAAGRTPPVSVSGDLGGQTLTPGVYRSTSSLGLTGPVTLDAQGDPNAVFVFQVASTLITATDSSVNLIGGAQACNVFWQVGSSATLGTYSTFRGNILALTSGTLNTGATVDGRVLARNGAVTLDNNVITIARCAPGTTGGTTGGGGSGGGGGGGGTTGGGTTGTSPTAAKAPSVTTGSAMALPSGGARLGGMVNPNGATTTYYFQYGTTRRYGRRTPKLPAGSKSKTFPVSTRIRRLRPGRRYHYRLVAVSPLGKRVGKDRTFRTARPRRVAPTTPTFTG